MWELLDDAQCSQKTTLYEGFVCYCGKTSIAKEWVVVMHAMFQVSMMAQLGVDVRR